MSWEQSRRQRTIATSRSDDNRDEARKVTAARARSGPRPTNPKGREPRSAPPLRSRSEENRFRLTNSFRKGPTRRGEITSKRSPLRSSRGDPQGDGGPAVVRSAARCGRCSRWRRPPLSRPGWSARDWRRARRRRGRPPRRRRTSGDWPGRSGDTQSGEGAGAGRNYCGWSGCGGAARRSSSARRFPSLRDLRGAASRFSSSVTDCRRAQLAARFLW